MLLKGERKKGKRREEKNEKKRENRKKMKKQNKQMIREQEIINIKQCPGKWPRDKLKCHLPADVFSYCVCMLAS